MVDASVVYSGNFNVQIGRPLDARQKQEFKADLTNPEKWKANDGKTYLWKGMNVYVDETDKWYYLSTDPKQTYTGTDSETHFSYEDINNWKEIGGEVVTGIRYDAEKDSIAEGIDSTKGNLPSATGIRSHAEGYNTTASGFASHAEGVSTKASGWYSHAEGSDNTASGQYSHAEGNKTTASGKYSHAEGVSTKASGQYSHAEGNETTASGQYSHAEGFVTAAYGNYQHVEGYHTAAYGNYQHVEGYHTVGATGADTQHVSGKFNVPDKNALFIIGNGTRDDLRSNAMVVGSTGLMKIGSIQANKQDDQASDKYFATDGSIQSISAISGPQGATGPQGEKGATGATGPVGPQGPVGPAAGFANPEVTTTILADSVDPTVSVAATGEDTAKKFTFTFGLPRGYQGKTGLQGDQGVQGVTGPTGDKGIQGATGEQGLQGVTGPIGVQGATGPVGLPGVSGTVSDLVVKLNSGTTEDTDMFTYNGKTAKNVDITAEKIGALPITGGTLSGPVTSTSTISSNEGFFDTSDIRKKNILHEISLDKCLELIDKCQTIIYTLKDDENNNEQIGMIAQEVEQYFPEIVQTDSNGYKSISYGRLSVICLRILKEVIREINTLKGK